MPANTTNNAKRSSGLDILFAAIDYELSSNETSTSTPPLAPTTSKKPTPTPNPNPAERVVSVNPFRSKMDPRMKKSITARALNPNMLDEEAVLAGFVFPERGVSADINWIGEGNVSMRQRKINFRRSWKRFQSRQIKEVATEMARSTPAVVIPSSPVDSTQYYGVECCNTSVASDEDPTSIVSSPKRPADQLSSDNYLALPKKRSANTFPRALISILSDPELDHIISWMPSGDAFGIHKQKEFESEIIPKYFRQARFNSFVRKLNRWGFHRVSKNTSHLGGSIIFRREDFKRDAPSSLTMKPLDNSTSEFHKVPIDDLVKTVMSIEAAACQATCSPAMTTLRSISLGPDDLVLLHGLKATQPSDRMMSGMSRLLFQQQQHLYCLSQKTNHSRALLHSMRL
mmetsp:Transcript_22247/g.36564  ORF Transcript_22247/g.36564 Transcript_22247/m.36564 type:complete len:400 (-) Transcript_22247:84-1283(-)